MATSAFKSTTRRTSVGVSSSTEDSEGQAHRRSRSLSRFSRRILPPDCSTDVPPSRGRFVNIVRGSVFPEISFDDQAIDLFSDEGVRLLRRSSDVITPFTSSDASQRRGRPVLRQIAGVNDETSSASKNSSRTRCVANKASADQYSRRRRSVSVVRNHIIDSESRMDQSSFKSSNNGIQNRIITRNTHLSSLEKPKASNHRQGFGRSLSQKDLSNLQDGYSSHSSVLTDDELRDLHAAKHGSGKIMRVANAHKMEYPTRDDNYSGLCEAMRVELRHAVKEIKKELGQANMRPRSFVLGNDDRLRSNNSNVLEADSTIRRNNDATNLKPEERGRAVSKNAPVIEKTSRNRKRSNDRNKMSKRLTEEAEKYLEDFISNVEDADISSFDGERSDGSFTLRGINNPSVATTATTTANTEVDGVSLPWLQWEASSHDSSPMISKIVQPLTIQDEASTNRKNSVDGSSGGNWSPGTKGSIDSPKASFGCFKKQHDSSEERIQRPGFDIEDYLHLQTYEDHLFETLELQRSTKSGRLLLCNNLLHSNHLFI